MLRFVRALSALALFVGATSITAQQPVPPGAAQALRDAIARSARDPQAVPLPPVDSFALGGRLISAGETVRGRVAVAYGDLIVNGTLQGDAIAVDGDVVIAAGGRVTGDALAIRGRVRLTGGAVEGEMRTLSNLASGERVAVQMTAAERTKRAVYIVGSVLGLLLLVGIGVLVFAGDNLEGVVETLERRFARSFLVGIAGQLALVPVLLIGLAALAITLIGILLIPFAAVAYALAAAGLFTLGFLAIARVSGKTLIRPTSGSQRKASLSALTVGVLAYFAIWLLAAAFTWSPVAGPILRVIAAIITWVALTAGAGAVILSRAGTRRLPVVLPPAEMEDSRSWETPTPVSGVVAARRPTPAPMQEMR